MEKKKKIDLQKLREYFAKFSRKYQTRAEEVLGNKDKLTSLLQRARQKAQAGKGPLDEAFLKLRLVLNLLNDYIRGTYRVIPYKTLIMVVLAILYFVNVVDFIPDLIPVAGLIDDAAVLSFVASQANADLKTYEKWKYEQLDQQPPVDEAGFSI
jgi:uncharacterized membrane protein YkvA (DUF1232 family)